jgi:hypothetical protein
MRAFTILYATLTLRETAPRVRQDLPLSPFDLLRPVVSPGPPFSVVLTD